MNLETFEEEMLRLKVRLALAEQQSSGERTYSLEEAE